MNSKSLLDLSNVKHKLKFLFSYFFILIRDQIEKRENMNGENER